MRIGVLSRGRELYSTRRLIEAVRSRGHEPVLIDTMSIAVEFGLSDEQVRLVDVQTAVSHQRYLPRSQNSGYMPQIDAMIPRIGSSITYYGVAVVRMLEGRGVATTATADGIACSRDKFQSLQLMAQMGLPVPRTVLATTPQAAFSAMQTIGKPPIVVKLVQGTQGQGVFLVPNVATVTAVLAKLRTLNKPALIQEYIAESRGQDTRILVVGNRCVAAMRRSSANGDFRSNLHLGGTAVSVELDPEIKKLAIIATKAHGLGVAGVDILQSKRGPLLLEINSSPGLEGIETTTGVDVADAIVRYLEDGEPEGDIYD